MNLVLLDVKSVDSKFTGKMYVNTDQIAIINKESRLIGLSNGNVLKIDEKSFKLLGLDVTKGKK